MESKGHRIEDANYFTGVDQLSLQIQEHRRAFFDHPEGTISNEYLRRVGFIARNMIVDQLQGSEIHLNHGVLTGLVLVQFTKPSIRSGLETHLRKLNPVDNSDPSAQFLIKNMPRNKEIYIDERFRDELTPTLETLAGLYGFDGECDQSARARESVVTGFIAGANTIISMCDEWESWTRDMRLRVRADH